MLRRQHCMIKNVYSLLSLSGFESRLNWHLIVRSCMSFWVSFLPQFLLLWYGTTHMKCLAHWLSNIRNQWLWDYRVFSHVHVHVRSGPWMHERTVPFTRWLKGVSVAPTAASSLWTLLLWHVKITYKGICVQPFRLDCLVSSLALCLLLYYFGRNSGYFCCH